MDRQPPISPVITDPATARGSVSIDRIANALRPGYEVIREVGRGGAAVVFLAEDHKHRRNVALKVLDAEVSTQSAEKFVREIRIAARLTHPHILPVLDSGVAGGMPFYVMPFVEGETLRNLLQPARHLAVRQVIQLARETADALDYANAARIVHRDVKPENILMLENHAVLADFGVARAIVATTGEENLDDDTATRAGLVVGTPAYMSPEQAANEMDLDGRSDQFALAIVVYEMITGVVPFAGASTMATLARRFGAPPPGLRTLRPELPAALDHAVLRALSRERDQRFDSSSAFVGALSESIRSSAAFSRGGSSPAADADERKPSIAVLPFANTTNDADTEFFSDGITDEIIGALSRLRQLRVAARGSCYAMRGQNEDSRIVGERLGVETILEGGVRRVGQHVRVSAHLVNARSGYLLWSEQYDRRLDDIFAIQDEIAHAIVDTLQVRLLGDTTRAIVASPTGSSAAHDAYLRATHASRRRTESGLRSSVELFREALRIDPDFAAAHAGLADSLALLAVYGVAPAHDVMGAARQAAEEALRLDPTAAGAWTRLASIRALYDHDWPGARDAFRRALALGPRSSTVHQRYALDYLVPQGDLDGAREHIATARSLDPLSPVMRTSEAVVEYFAGNLERARDAARAAVASDPTFAIAEFFLGTIARDSGEVDEATAAFGRAIELSGGTPEMLAGLAQTDAHAGRLASSRNLLERMTAMSTERFVSPSLFAQVELALENTDRALDWLEKAEAAADPELIHLGVRPVYRPLVRAPRFIALLERVGLPAGSGPPQSMR